MRRHLHLVVETANGNLAVRFRRATTVTLRWITARLLAGRWKRFATKLHRWRKNRNSPDNSSRL
jgi:hypothetical protein